MRFTMLCIERHQFALIRLPANETLHDWIVGGLHFGWRAIENHFPVMKHDDAICDFERAGHIVRDRDAGDVQPLIQPHD